MKRRNFIGISGCSALTALTGGCSTLRNGARGEDLVATPQERAKYTLSLLDELCTRLGPHPSGSRAYDRAADCYAREMKKSLLRVEFDRFEFENWELFGKPEFVLGDTPLETFPGYGTPATPSQGVRGTLRKNVEGAAYGVVEDGRVKALVSLSSYGGALSQYFSPDATPRLPRFSIGKQDAPLLERAVRDQTPVRVKSPARFVPHTRSSSIVGKIPGRTSGEILILAHADTKYNSPGANDNTASVIVMLMLAHAFSRQRGKYGLTVVATGGEESGMLGAEHYAACRESEGTMRNIRYVLNFDSLTYGPNLWINTTEGDLKSMLRDIHEDLHIPGVPKFYDTTGFILDAEPFRNSGAKAANVNSRGYDQVTLPVYHRPDDTPDKIYMDTVENSFLVFREFIRRIQEG